jgi:hypothetical protein
MSDHSDLVGLLAQVTSISLLVLVIELVRRRKLVEEYAFVWIIGTGALLVLSLWRRILDRLALWIGVFYPPAVLLLVVILFGYLAALYFSIVASQQRRQISRLVEDVAILAAEVRELKDRSAPEERR